MVMFLNIYNRFIGGRNINNAIKKIQATSFIPVFDKAKEGNQKIDDVNKDTESILQDIKVIGSIKFNSPVFYALKGSTFGIDYLPLSFTYKMVREVVKQAKSHHIKVLFDAEQSWHTKSEDLIVNKLYDDNLDVFKTYQMYRKDSLYRLVQDLEKGTVTKFKIVRGAYMEQELNCIIHETKEAVDDSYDQAANILLNSTHTKEIMLATHNTCSILKARNQILEKNVSRDKIYFAQLMGMENKVNIPNNRAVYIPYGKLIETLPYLCRRLYENKYWFIKYF